MFQRRKRERKKKKKRKKKESGIRRRAGRGRRPVILCNTRPKDKDHDDGEEGEERLKEASVDLAVGAVADVDADNELKDLGDGKEDGGGYEVY